MIVVSARGEVDDRILGLHSGADDYLVKPYDIGELLARVHAVYRRRRPGPGSATGDIVVVDDVAVDLERHTVTVAGRPVTLTRKEFQVLGMLAASRGAVCTRSRIVAEVWGRTWAGREPDAGRARRHAAHQARPPGAGADRARRRLPARLPDPLPGTDPMRTRLLVIVLVLVGLLAVGLGVPLAVTDVAGPAVASCSPSSSPTRSSTPRSPSGRSPRPTPPGSAAELQRYDEVYGVAVLVFDREGRLIASLAPGPARPRRGGARAAGAGAGQPALGRLRAALAVGRPAVRDRRARAGGHRGARGGGHRRADRRPAHLRGAGVARRAGRGPARAHARGRRRAADRALDPAPGPAARRGHRAGRVGGARGRRARPGRATAAARRSCGGSRCRSTGWPRRWRRPTARSARSSPTPATSCATRSPRCGCGCPTSTGTSTRSRRRTRSPRWRRPSGSPRCSTACSRWPGPSARPRSSPVDVDAGVDDRIEAWRPLAEHSGLRLRRDGPARAARHRDGRGHRDPARRGARQRREVHARPAAR